VSNDPHGDGPVQRSGSSLEDAAGVVILLHGRGSSATDIMSLAHEVDFPSLAFFAPQASGNSWYPYSFLAPKAQNEPWLSSALNKVQATVQLAVDAGISAERIVIGGFSQGACLATEFVASHPQRYAGLVAFTGGLIGPLGADLTHQGDLAGTPVFFGSGDPDTHVPWERVQQSAMVLEEMGASVTIRRYEGRAHTITGDELNHAKRLIREAFFNLEE
jgi:phospholipase/carboxylesterase